MRRARRSLADRQVAAEALALEVDGKTIVPSETLAYKAMMLSDVPNLALAIGYTNASWTLKADLVAEFVCRVLAHMDQVGATKVMARRDPEVKEEPFMDFEAGYVLRSLDDLPKQGDREPWKLKQSYFHDVRTIRKATIDDGNLEFSSPV